MPVLYHFQCRTPTPTPPHPRSARPSLFLYTRAFFSSLSALLSLIHVSAPATLCLTPPPTRSSSPSSPHESTHRISCLYAHSELRSPSFYSAHSALSYYRDLILNLFCTSPSPPPPHTHTIPFNSTPSIMSSRVEVFQSQLPAYNRIKTPYEAELVSTVRKMLAPGKGLLAADESIGSCAKRFQPIGLSNTEEHRRQYRALMLEAEGFEQYISGVILHDETVGQKASNGQTFPEYLTARGVVPGIKTDMGLCPLLEGAEGEQMTEGLDGYVKRASAYYKKGCRFCKWRNVYKIQNGTVSEPAVRFNAETLARYAILSQMSGLVPIVEPEVMIDGKHDIDTCQRVSEHVWREVVAALQRHGVVWEGCLLKPNMVVPGAESGKTATPEQVAQYTVMTLARTMPAMLPGVTFLSGGLSEVQASEYLNAINKSPLPRPFTLTFSYARALQSSALKAWGGKESGVAAGRSAFLHRARMNSLAQLGKYNRADDDASSASLYVKGNTY